ncbi:MAG: hypothetical protein ABUT20_30100 [Bacteroidota bacterium]
MFTEIFLFEIKNRLRRPAVYLYFAAALVFTMISFATGSLPLGDKENINAPYLIAMWCAGITMMMMLVSSSVMGVALYRDIEYNTRDYYLTYPITKPGYFWGRYLGSFTCMLFIATAILVGIYAGSKLGPLMGWTDSKEYGPDKLIYYLHPFFTIAVPNLFFTSSLFFALVALTRNVKVIYSGGILLFLGYFLALFFLNNTNNATVINLADPFALNGIRLGTGAASDVQKNTTLFPVQGVFLFNRILWPSIGLVVLVYSYIRFNFEKFFSGKRDTSAIDEDGTRIKRSLKTGVSVNFTGRYNRNTLLSLVRLELKNIIRDNYFWIIISSGMAFLGFVFWMGHREYNVPYLPRTVELLEIFLDIFPFFLFFVIIFYTGETLHRDRSTRYAFINDSLPPPNWVLNGSKLIALLVLAIFLTVLPVLLAITVQTIKGFHHYNFPIYVTSLFLIILPRLLEMVFISYVLHVVINNKFAAYGVGITLWVVMFFADISGIFNYNLLLYSFTPRTRISDMDGLGHMTGPVTWFNLYWLLAGGLLVIISALFYYRGVSTSFKERLRLIPQRFDTKTKWFCLSLSVPFLVIGAFLYYNVSYLNTFLLKTESSDRAILYEKVLKPYSHQPLPKITAIKMETDLYPDKQQAFVRAMVTVTNNTTEPIKEMLVDAEGLTDFSISIHGEAVPFSYPLLYPRAMFSWFRPAKDTSDFRLYTLTHQLMPGDSAVLEINSTTIPKGFTNSLYAANLLRNGVFFSLGLPALGYDEDEEVYSPYVRKKSGLPEKKEEEIAQDDPEGLNTLKAGKAADLLNIDITISTEAGQTALFPGVLKKQWTTGNRSYFQYINNPPGMYMPAGIISARYAVAADTVQTTRTIPVRIYYHPEHGINVPKFMAGYKDGLRYFSSVFGEYPFSDIKLAETSVYGPRESSMTSLDSYAEYNSWSADFTDSNQFDYLYFNITRQLAQQWWRFQVAPNNTVGGLIIPEGLATYSALVMAEKKYGPENMRWLLQDQLWAYLFIRRHLGGPEHPVIKADQWFEWGGKTGVILFGLRDLIGEDSMNVALREFKDAYEFKNRGPFAGAPDLFHFLQKHTPDSVRYYLEDGFKKITLYDNKILEATIMPAGNKGDYKVDFTVNVTKAWMDEKGNDIDVPRMNDFIDIGIFGTDSTDKKSGRSVTNQLYLQKYRLTAGSHSFSITVKGKPVSVGIDPYAKLVDRQPNDNMRNF